MGDAKGIAGTKVDLHMHSRASGTAISPWVKGLGPESVEVRESYTPPEDAYRMAKAAGMDLVTLTDHETIEGAKELAARPDFFFGEEVTAVFPEDGSQVDVLVYGMTDDHHREAQARRGDVCALVAYLREAGVAHVLAHPVYGVPGDLDRTRIEKRAVLFGLWEFINGSRPARQNRLSRDIAAKMDGSTLRQLAAEHGLPVPPHAKIAGTAGSDDHGGLYIGAAHTVAPAGISSPAEFLEALKAGEVWPAGESGSSRKVAHTGVRIAGQALGGTSSAEAGSVVGALGNLRRLAPSVLPKPLGDTVGRLLGRRSGAAAEEKLLPYVPLLARLDMDGMRRALVSRYEERLAGALRGMGSGFPLIDLLGSLGDLVDGHLFVAPYVGVHGYFGRENGKARVLERELFPGRPEPLKVGVFVDGMDAVHGVATMYRNLEILARDGDTPLEIVRCGVKDAAGAKNIKNMHSLRSVATLPVPLYEGLELGVPSLLDVLDHVAESEYSVLHVATPGPLGLAALVAGLTLGIPVVGAYHTELGAYARALSGDAMVAEVVEVAVREFYERCAAVAVPSEATALALRNRGYRIRRYEVLKNGVDNELFDPRRRDEGLRRTLGGGRKLLLYAGRVSREKGLEGLAKGYLALLNRRDDVHLVVAGDGPYRRELEALLGEKATFTGFLEGEDLARHFASADVFVFPSTTDTLGRAVAEAQASGLPAIVVGTGGPRECLSPGESGFVVDAGDEAGFFDRIEELLDDEGRRARMGLAARAFAESLSWEAVLDGLVALHRRVAGPDAAVPETAPVVPEVAPVPASGLDATSEPVSVRR
jgi:glycosyltransferase involved in cell wall biosynthesis